MGLKQDPQVRPRTERSASPIGRQPRCQRGAWGADGARPHRTSSFRFQSQRPSLLSPISLRSLYRSLYRSLALSLSLSTHHGMAGMEPSHHQNPCGLLNTQTMKPFPCEWLQSDAELPSVMGISTIGMLWDHPPSLVWRPYQGNLTHTRMIMADELTHTIR